jgi:PTH1 family peptidyl-tRNA hydrolase
MRGGSGGHNGVESVLGHLGEGFVRFRIGIGPKDPPEMDLKDFVLGKFTDYQQETVDKKMSEYLEGLQCLVDRGPVLAMNHINQREKKDEPDGNKK